MQRLTSAELDQRLDVVVDPDASPGDVLPLLARLLIDRATKRSSEEAAPP